MDVKKKGVSESLRTSRREIENINLWALGDWREKMIAWNDFVNVLDYSVAVILSIVLKTLSSRNILRQRMSRNDYFILDKVRFLNRALIFY